MLARMGTAKSCRAFAIEENRLRASQSFSGMQFVIYGKTLRDRKFDKFPFQCFTTLTAKKLFLVAKLQAASHRLNAFFLLTSLVEMGNSWSPSST